MSKGIEGFKRKPTANHALHKGLLLLVYEFLKTQTRGKSLGDLGCASKEIGSLDFGDVHSIKSDDEENTSSKVNLAACIPYRKSLRSLSPIPLKPEPHEEKEDSEEEEEIDLEEEEKGKDNLMEEVKGRESDKEEEEALDDTL